MLTRRHIYLAIMFAVAAAATGPWIHAQNGLEKRRLSRVSIVAPGVDPASRQVKEYTDIVTEALGPVYSTPRIRDAIEDLYLRARTINTITVAAEIDAAGDVLLTFNLRMKTQASRVTIEVTESIGDDIT